VRALALATVVGALVASPAAPQAVRVPAVALDAAAAGVVPLAAILARADVTAGLVTRDNPSDFSFVRQVKPAAAQAVLVPIADVLARFRQAHPAYDVSWRDGVLHLVQAALPCASLVGTTPFGPMQFTGDAGKALVFLTWLARGLTSQPRGMTGSVLGSVDDLAKTPPSIVYTLPAQKPIANVFDEIIRAAKGGVWVAWQRARADGRIGCRSVAYWPNGLVTAAEEDFGILETGNVGSSGTQGIVVGRYSQRQLPYFQQ
jgi:hypothetical protein